jgi:16S rRNA processing protein RimM
MPDLTQIGRILRPHGVRGEMVVEVEAAGDELAEAGTVYLGQPPIAHRLDGLRRHRGRLLIHLAGCDDREAAEAYRDLPLAIERAELPRLPAGTYYWSQIIGLTVVTDAGETLGQVAEIIETGANDVYVVRGAAGEVLIPAAPGVVLTVDLAAGRMTVHLLEGLR